MQTAYSQRGMSTSSWILVIGLFGVILTILAKMLPSYIDNATIRSTMKSMAVNVPDFHSLDEQEIKSNLFRFFLINGVRDYDQDSLDIVKTSERTLVNFEYEKRVHLFLNIDTVMIFRNQLDSQHPDKCCKFLIENDK